MADALDDFVKLTGAVGNFTGSLAALYDMKTQKQTERIQAQITQKQGEFLDRMRLMPGDPNRIDETNWHESLEAFDSDVSSAIGGINEQVVRDRVSNGLAGMNQQFHNGIANALYQKEIERAQNEALAADSIRLAQIGAMEDKDVETVEEDPDTGAKTVTRHNAYREAVDLYMKTVLEPDEAGGLFDPEAATKRRQAVEKILYGKQYGDDALAASGEIQDFEKAQLSVASMGISDNIKQGAIAYIQQQGAKADIAADTQMSNIEKNYRETGDYSNVDAAIALSASAVCTKEMKDKLFARAQIVAENGINTNMNNYVSNQLKTWRLGDNGHIYNALSGLSDMYSKLETGQKLDPKIAAAYRENIDSLLSKLRESKTDGTKMAEDAAERTYLGLWTRYNERDPKVTVPLLAATLIGLSGSMDPAKYQKHYEDLLGNEAYKAVPGMKDFFEPSTRNGKMAQMIMTNLGSSMDMAGVSAAKRSEIMTFCKAVGNEAAYNKLAPAVRAKGELFFQDFFAQMWAGAQNGKLMNEQELGDVLIARALPLLSHWDVLGVDAKQGLSGLKGAKSILGAMDSGQFSPLYQDSAFQGVDTKSKVVEQFQQNILGAMKQNGDMTLIPKGFNYEDLRGDIWFTNPEKPDVRYSVDAGTNGKDYDVQKYVRKRGKNGDTWVKDGKPVNEVKQSVPAKSIIQGTSGARNRAETMDSNGVK